MANGIDDVHIKAAIDTVLSGATLYTTNGANDFHQGRLQMHLQNKGGGDREY